MTQETCDQGTEADFPSGIPTLCASAPEGISGDYAVDVSIELPYKFVMSVSSNELSGSTTREIVMLATANEEEGSLYQSLNIPNTNDGETEVLVTMLDESMGLPGKPIVTLT
jgi:hypothetical protein